MHLAPAIDQVLEIKKSKLLGRLTYYQIAGILTRGYKRAEIPFKFRFETFEDYGPDDLSVSGLYDMEEDIKYIILNFPKETKHFTISNKNWREFKFAVSQVCQHETIHQIQWMNRELDGEPCDIDFRNLTGSISEEKEYLADIDEIDAYGHDIAMEIKYSYPKKDPYEILRTIDSRKKVWSYNYYKKTFKGDDWSKIKNRLLKKTYQWLPYVTV
jgi:hypothetical protein